MEDVQRNRLHEQIENATVRIFLGNTFKGTGFFISPNGYVLTAYHCIGKYAPEIWIKTRFDGKYLAQLEIDKSLLAEEYDIAVLQTFGYQPSHYIPLGLISRQNIRDEVVAIGYPDNRYRLYEGRIVGVDETTLASDVIRGEGQSGGSVYHYRSQRVVGLASAIFKRQVIVNEGLAVRFEALFKKWWELEEINRKVGKEWDKRLNQQETSRSTTPLIPKENEYLQERKSPGTVFQDKLKDGGLGPEMVIIPAGKFIMGDDKGDSDEKPAHQVTIAYEFALGKYPITFDEYDLFCQATGREKPGDENWGRGKRPVIDVYWHDAKDYCQWLSAQTGKTYRLSSEAEWEYACRAGTTTRFSFGDNEGDLSQYAWYTSNSDGKTHPVGEKKPNSWGLYDMHGNVWEWCEDTWHDNYQGAPVDGSAWVNSNENRRVLRGGSWNYIHNRVRSADRNWNSPTCRNYDWGFRVLVP